MSILLKAKLIAFLLVAVYAVWKIFFTKTKRVQKMRGANVSFSTEGRGGQVYYEGAEGAFSMYWEFGGGDTIAIIDVPSAAQWEARTKIPLEKRMEILNIIGRQTVEVQTTDGKGLYVIKGDCIEIKMP